MNDKKTLRKFDTKVQYLQYKVLREVARNAFNDTLLEKVTDIPKTIIPGNTPTMRCCVYKERAIIAERVKLAMGGNRSNPNVIEVIEIACDDCPAGGYEVTNACRGCLAHRCEDVCKRNAITFDHQQKAHIDKSLCVECGQCAKVCPYSAIVSRRRPCENSCKVKAISVNENKAASINNEKCIACGACVYQCPFGAMIDKSFILDVIDMIKKSDGNRAYKIAVLALGGTEMAAGRADRGGGVLAVQQHPAQAQAFGHGGAGSVEADERDAQFPGGEGGRDDLVEQVATQKELHVFGLQAALLDGLSDGVQVEALFGQLKGFLAVELILGHVVEQRAQRPFALFPAHIRRRR